VNEPTLSRYRYRFRTFAVFLRFQGVAQLTTATPLRGYMSGNGARTASLSTEGGMETARARRIGTAQRLAKFQAVQHKQRSLGECSRGFPAWMDGPTDCRFAGHSDPGGQRLTCTDWPVSACLMRPQQRSLGGGAPEAPWGRVSAVLNALASCRARQILAVNG
jgi:hypothetical protein